MDPSPPSETSQQQRCGLVAIVGRPNVGKSTLLNALVGQKVSITSRKAQTTRHRITGIRTVGATQFVFVDTPGFQTRHSTALNRNLNRTVQGVLGDQHTRPVEGRTIRRLDLTADPPARDRRGDRSDFRAVRRLELGVVADGPSVVVRAVVIRQAVGLAAGPGASGLRSKASRAEP